MGRIAETSPYLYDGERHRPWEKGEVEVETEEPCPRCEAIMRYHVETGRFFCSECKGLKKTIQKGKKRLSKNIRKEENE